MDKEDLAGTSFRALLKDLDAFLPATVSRMMHGAGGTLYVKRNSTFDRNDFVGIPASWRTLQVVAWVADDVHAGTLLWIMLQ